MCMMISYHTNQRNTPVMGSLSFVSPTTVCVYKVILIYLSLHIVYGQPEGRPIKCLMEVFIQVTIPSLLIRTKAQINRQ